LLEAVQVLTARITAIGLDQTAILGDTVEKIAGEKAGIIKPGGPVVLYRQQESVEQVIEAVCNERGAVLHRPNFGAVRSVSNSLDGQVFDVEGLSGLRLSLLGEHQLCNAAVVVETARVLRGAGWSIPDEAIRTGLAAARWPGRFELVQRDPIVLVDGGHNPQCVGS
ncbi:MAG: bifunctional folylpolyglutamate synthase/dihydrofolate synthase, partial [Oscillospiraceae bacterium]